MMMVMMIPMVIASMATMVMTMMIAMVMAVMMTGRFGKVAAQALFHQTFLRPTNLNKLAPTFQIIAPTSVFGFSRNTGFAARLHRHDDSDD